jgi:hypothetical protein
MGKPDRLLVIRPHDAIERHNKRTFDPGRLLD